MLLDTIDLAMRWLTYPVAWAICANQIDELFIDASYVLRGLHRRDRRVIPAQALRDVEQKRVAILLPAWKEADVIERMVEHNLAAIDYDPERLDIFCGTYRNDPDTQACVDRLARLHPRVHKVVVPHDGPTCKADCLNWIYQGLCLCERQRGTRFEILLMHDAEDVIHPLSLRLYSLLIPRHEFVQTPVFSLELGPGELVAGTYIDEFAEHHLKEMRVRQAMGGLVPSAGVGSAFERQAFEEIALAHRQQPFNPSSLTEDYEIGLKFRLAGKRVSFACHTVERLEPGAGGAGQRTREEYVATREYFPSRLRASVRQRSRWVLGITLQAWEQMGWQGALPVLYCLWRDRKGLLNSALVLLAYVLAAWALARGAVAAAGGPGWDPSLGAGALPALLAFNSGAMAWRILVKARFVGHLYGWLQALLVVPRLVLANLIGFLATGRALQMYLHHRITGRPLRWLKTAHAFPTAEALSVQRRRLGELLLERQSVGPVDLSAALALQGKLRLPLGEVLSAAGILSRRQVVHRLAEHFEMRVAHPDPLRAPAPLLRRLPEVEAEYLNALPFWQGPDRALVAVGQPLTSGHVAHLESRLGSPVETVLSMPRGLARSRSIAYRGALGLAPPGPRLGERLVERGELDRRALPALLEEQLEGREPLGEVLLRSGLCSPRSLDRALQPEGGFRTVGPDDCDPRAAGRLGYGHCALYSLVPLRERGPDGARIVAAALPVHPREASALAERLGEPVRVALAPRLQIRAALALARSRLPGESGAGWDGLEIAALVRCGFRRQGTPPWSGRPAGTSPLAHLESRGEIGPRTAAAARAQVFGLAVAPPLLRALPPGILPPSLERRGGIEVREAAAGALLLATPRPSPRLAREVSELLPGWRIAWEVAPARQQPEEVESDRAA